MTTKNKYTYIITGESLVLYIGNETHSFQSDSAQYPVLAKLLTEGASLSEVRKAMTKDGAVRRFLRGFSAIASEQEPQAKELNVTIRHGKVYCNGEEVQSSVADRIVQFMQAGMPWEPLARFLSNLMQNPSRNSRAELYKFLEHKHMPITMDGCFLAYRGLQDDYFSKHSDPNAKLIRGRMNANGQIYNGIGEEIEVPRSYVDDNQNEGCGRGLHIGSLEYATSWGPKVVIVKVNPRDAVCVPHDSNWQKLRACRYEVVEDYTGPLPMFRGMYGRFEQRAGSVVDRQAGRDTFLVAAINDGEMKFILDLIEQTTGDLPSALKYFSEHVQKKEAEEAKALQAKQDPRHVANGPFVLSFLAGKTTTRVLDKKPTFDLTEVTKNANSAAAMGLRVEVHNAKGQLVYKS